PHGAKQAFAQATNPITVCSLGVTERLTINPQTLNTLIDALGTTPIAAYLPEMLRFYFEFHDSQGEGYLAQIHDLLTVMIALGKITFSTRKVTVDVEADSELMRGTTVADLRGHWGDRKSTRLNSSHVSISYAVFCLKKKNYIYINLNQQTVNNVADINCQAMDVHHLLVIDMLVIQDSA